ncbi:4-methyl-5(B-hydroxyethyl)-thiazole monophosphate biosynthesis protein [Sulfurimicrobium lacus]|uniref:4-methyl-5(B-hydroxyethyl)-thiazole monophosphate biosynthesis protein n=1 Tax=Sulfurimicrobium lacus TaxID=2715678 RepID=A0A6F8VEM5_9PROT|nr:DJ-1 family glyoxalase III [Sulfurimicrobium lacus]BCB28134.1 4-methyl-5(B-hydroxyethyl)-thiazole monophosphate biosynthesis protein [Sulfurimicrobium lacus]
MPKVLVPLAEGCEEIEAVTIIDLLRRAAVDVVVAGLQPGIVKASRGTLLVPDCTLDVALRESYDMVVLPGGMPGMTHLRDDPRIIPLLQKMARDGKYTCAICAAPAVLAAAGLLSGKMATSYPGFVDRMDLPDTTFSNDAVVKDGTVITSRGPGTAMDFALELIETLLGRAKRDEVEAGLQRPGKY